MKHMSLFLIVAMMTCIVPITLANPVNVITYPDPRQDTWVLDGEYEELGINFPADELILAQEVAWEGHDPCPTDWQGAIWPNAQVQIVNLTGKAWAELYYVADPETFLTNVDELVDDANAPTGMGTLSFQIDWGGNNTPLVFESMNQDGIFEVGEIWEFVIQEYNNTLGLSAAALGSFGVSYASQGDPISSGSIVAIPEPSVVALLGISALGLFIRRRLMM